MSSFTHCSTSAALILIIFYNNTALQVFSKSFYRWTSISAVHFTPLLTMNLVVSSGIQLQRWEYFIHSGKNIIRAWCLDKKMHKYLYWRSSHKSTIHENMHGFPYILAHIPKQVIFNDKIITIHSLINHFSTTEYLSNYSCYVFRT